MQKLPTAAEVAKFLTALAGAGGIAIANGLAVGDVAKWLSIAISIVTAMAVFLVPNTPAATTDKTATDPADSQPATDDPEVPAFVNTTGNTTTTTAVTPITDQPNTTTTPQATTETPLPPSNPPSNPPHGGGPA
jgi:hypothetical protein